MGVLARLRAKSSASNLIDADEAKRQAALDLSLALRKARSEQDQAVNAALTELANDLGIDVVISIAPGR